MTSNFNHIKMCTDYSGTAAIIYHIMITYNDMCLIIDLFHILPPPLQVYLEPRDPALSYSDQDDVSHPEPCSLGLQTHRTDLLFTRPRRFDSSFRRNRLVQLGCFTCMTKAWLNIAKKNRWPVILGTVAFTAACLCIYLPIGGLSHTLYLPLVKTLWAPPQSCTEMITLSVVSCVPVFSKHRDYQHWT